MSKHETMPGDAEAAGAVAGMIESSGAEAKRMVYEAWIASDWSKQDGFKVYESEFEVVSEVDGHLILRSKSGMITLHRAYQPNFESRLLALNYAIKTLTERREKLTEQIVALKRALLVEAEGTVQEGN